MNLTNGVALSIIIPVRQTKAENRGTERLERCLDSIRRQTVAGKIEAIVVDTDSGPAFRKRHQEIAKAKKARYIYAKTGQPWNISRARNIGIRAARGRFVMSTDMDCIFSRTFIETALRHAADGTIVHCRIGDLPENYAGPWDDENAMAAVAVLRPAWCFGGCQIVSREWAESVHGYDEEFFLWGADDNDFFERAVAAGKRNLWIEAEARYFHQWHSDAGRKASAKQTERNRARFKLTEAKRLPIVRNPHAWGMEPVRNEWDDTAIVVTAFIRDASLARALEQVRKAYPTIDIYVADNGKPTEAKAAACAMFGATVIPVAFDAGVTVARNAAIRAIRDRYSFIMVIEDDIGFGPESKLEDLRAVLRADTDVGIAGGSLQVVTNYAGTYPQNYEAMLSIDSATRTIALRKADPLPAALTAGGVAYHLVDIILNVFMAKAEIFDHVLWDENIKSAPEHCDFFLAFKFRTPKLKANRVAFVPSVILNHHREAVVLLNAEYQSYRTRAAAFTYFGKKWDCDFFFNSWNPKWGIKNPMELARFGADGSTAKLAVFRNAAQALDEAGALWWLEAGTCLGAVREKDFIAHDPDIDVGVWDDHPAAALERIAARMADKGFDEVGRREKDGRLIQAAFRQADVKVDVFFFYERAGMAWHGAFGPANPNGTGEYNVFLPHVFTRRLFRDMKRIDFHGIPVAVPSPVDQYLNERYGPNWRTPDAGYQYWKDCRAVCRHFFDRAGRVAFISGAWDILHEGHLDVLERAATLADRILVGVVSDAALTAAGRPAVIGDKSRARVVGALRVVDDVIAIEGVDPTSALEAGKIAPDYIIRADSMDYVPGAEAVRATGGFPLLMPRTKGISSALVRMVGSGREAAAPIRRARRDGEPRLAVAIKTFLREATLERTVKALRAAGFEHRLYICDDSGRISDRKAMMYQELRRAGAQIIERPFDSGISAGRNALIRAIDEPFVLLTDDDIMVAGADDLARMFAVLDARPDVGIVAAKIENEAGGPFTSDAYARGLKLELNGGLLKRTPMNSEIRKAAMADGRETIFRVADQVPNCFLARREVFDSTRWDDRIKVEYEHMDFFLCLKKTGVWKAAVALEAKAIHYPSEPDMDYLRSRRAYSPAYFKQKHGIENIVSQF